MPWDDTARVEHRRDTARYPSDLTDREWALIAPLLPGAIGVRRDGQKVLLSIKNMGGESKAAWGAFLADLDARGLIALDLAA